MIKFTVVAIVSLMVPGVAAAQSEARFHTGAVSWTPTLALRDTGVDTNLYDEFANPKRDTVAVFSPQVTGLAKLAAADVRFGGRVDFVYFRRYADERAVNRGADVRVNFRGMRIQPYARGAFLDARERSNSEIDLRARRADRSGGAGVVLSLTPRASMAVGGFLTQSTYRQGQIYRGVDLAERLNREGTGAELRFRYEATPLTGIVVEGGASRDRFMRSPGYDGNNFQVRAGFEFDPDAVLDGRATVGFHRIEPVGAQATGFQGVTTDVELRYVLLQRTQFGVRVYRDTSYSMEAQPYFVETRYGGEVRHNLIGPLDVIGRSSWETLDYPGLEALRVSPDMLHVRRHGGAVAFQPGASLQLTVNYEFTRRDSELIADRGYERHRVFTNVIYGF